MGEASRNTADAAPVNLPLHSSLTHEQHPEILELLHLGKDFFSVALDEIKPKKDSHVSPVKHGNGYILHGSIWNSPLSCVKCKVLVYRVKYSSSRKTNPLQHQNRKHEVEL